MSSSCGRERVGQSGYYFIDLNDTQFLRFKIKSWFINEMSRHPHHFLNVRRARTHPEIHFFIVIFVAYFPRAPRLAVNLCSSDVKNSILRKVIDGNESEDPHATSR